MTAILPLDHADIPALVALWHDCDLIRPWNDPTADARLAIDGATATILGAHEGDRLIASVMTGFDGHRGWVYYLAVSPLHRRLGLGRSLMQAAEHWLRDRGAPKIQLMVRGDNLLATGFYTALGYATQDVVTLGKRLDLEGPP